MTEQGSRTPSQGAQGGFDERYVGPLQPDAVLPQQFFGALKRRARLDGERRLMMAVLEDAVHCYRKHACSSDPRAHQLYLDAEAWITGTDRLWFFSFENVCDSLELDPSYVRGGLVAWNRAAPDDPSLAHRLAAASALQTSS
jgi:hypothetical protein